MRQYTCGHSDVGDRWCDLRRLQNKECNRFNLTPETIVETDKCASCKEGDTAVDACHQDFTHPNVVSTPAFGFEGHGRFDESLKLTEEVRKPEQAQSLESEQSLNEEDPRPSFPRLPNLSASPTSSEYSSQPIHAVPGLAHNLSLNPQHRKRLPEWGPQHAGHSLLTDGLLSVTALQPLRNYGATPLRTLLAKYYLLDAISHVNLVNVNSCLDVVHSEPPIRPLAVRVAWLYTKPPKVWLNIRRMIPNLYTDVLHDILYTISDAKLYTDYVLFHTPSRPTLGPIEQGFACPALFDCVLVRQYMLNMLFREIQDFILKLSRPRLESGKDIYPDARSPSDFQSYAKSVPPKDMGPDTASNRPGKLNCDGLQQTLRVIATYSLPLISATYPGRISRVWLKISLSKDGTFSRLMDLQDRRYPLEADDRESYAQGFLFAP
uniref:Uncharacterized protein n=1 Tax=Cladonia uncialis subsp. uncialis TaxID=180999 RepID=A0A2K9YDF9_CLAUC|nr:hypothetical protein [Cladonia uncialis subsp. uncialis]